MGQFTLGQFTLSRYNVAKVTCNRSKRLSQCWSQYSPLDTLHPYPCIVSFPSAHFKHFSHSPPGFLPKFLFFSRFLSLEESKISWAYIKCIAHGNIQPPQSSIHSFFSAFYLNTRIACTFQCLLGFIKMFLIRSFASNPELTTSWHREYVWFSQARSCYFKGLMIGKLFTALSYLQHLDTRIRFVWCWRKFLNLKTGPKAKNLLNFSNSIKADCFTNLKFSTVNNIPLDDAELLFWS